MHRRSARVRRIYACSSGRRKRRLSGVIDLRFLLIQFSPFLGFLSALPALLWNSAAAAVQHKYSAAAVQHNAHALRTAIAMDGTLVYSARNSAPSSVTQSPAADPSGAIAAMPPDTLHSAAYPPPPPKDDLEEGDPFGDPFITGGPAQWEARPSGLAKLLASATADSATLPPHCTAIRSLPIEETPIVVTTDALTFMQSNISRTYREPYPNQNILQNGREGAALAGRRWRGQRRR